MKDIIELIARRTQLPQRSVRAVVELLETGATVPFISRYRRGQTGDMDEDQIRAIAKAHDFYTELNKRKETVLKTIEEQGKLTPELRAQIIACDDDNILEDLYLPYKPKRKTKATVAIEQGLEPLADLIMKALNGDTDELVRQFINGEICTKKEALQGAQYIIAERITENPQIRSFIRNTMQNNGLVTSKKKKTDHKEAFKFDLYDDFHIDVSKIKPHQLLALNRGENLGILSMNIEANQEAIEAYITTLLKINPKLVFFEEYKGAVKLAVSRYLEPSIEREVRKALKEISDLHAVGVFSQNLRNLLLQPPLANQVVLGIDPGFASGCKVAVVDETGQYLRGTVIYPTPPRNHVAEAERTVVDLIQKYEVTLIAIGNGTASRETETFVANLLKKHKLSAKYIIVSEAGASVYSASEIAKKEFPQLEAAERGNISIARRIQDPLAELVKIEPKSLGVGLYQHDVDQNMLDAELTAVVESAVNEVGVDLNSASAKLLSFVSGLNERLANEIVAHRNRIKRFDNRKELLEVKGIGEKAYEQCAGFLRIRGGSEPLDNTAVHPESYDKVRALSEHFKIPMTDLPKLGLTLLKMDAKKAMETADKIGIDRPTFELIANQLAKPGRDPRDEAPKPLLRSDVLKLEDLNEGMILDGTVRNVVDFGAFVDIGLKNDALLHVSKMAAPGRRVKSPLEVLQVGDIVQVKIDKIEFEKDRVALALSESAFTG